MNNSEIIDAVKQGMKNAAHDTYIMNFSSGGQINTEYVATVSIGQALLKSKTFRVDDEQIMFEYDTGQFITSTVPFSKKLTPGLMFSKHIVRIHANTSRTGRIDIVLLGNNNGMPYPMCAIEVKGNSPQKPRLIEDIRRNLEYFKHTANTGASKLGIAVNCAFESFNRKTSKKKYCITTTERNNKISNVKNKYEKYIQEIKKEIPSGVRYDIEVFSASETLLPPQATQEDFEQLEDQIHLTLGILIKFER